MCLPISKWPISYRRLAFRVFPDPPPLYHCQRGSVGLQPLVGLQEYCKGRRSLLGQAFTASCLSVCHVSPSALFSVSPIPGSEANVCLSLQRPCHAYLIFLFGSSSQIGKVRQASNHPNTASVSTTCADPCQLVLLPRRVHDVVVRPSLNPSRGGPPLFPNLYARIFADPMILGHRFTQCGRRRKRSVSLPSLHTECSFHLITFRSF
jgi:hypothetical protein